MIGESYPTINMAKSLDPSLHGNSEINIKSIISNIQQNENPRAQEPGLFGTMLTKLFEDGKYEENANSFKGRTASKKQIAYEGAIDKKFVEKSGKLKSKTSSKEKYKMNEDIFNEGRVKSNYQKQKSKVDSPSNSPVFDEESHKKQLQQLTNHFFNNHLEENSYKGFNLKYLKVYFTSQVLKNPFLAQFLLCSFSEEEDSNQDIINFNLELLNQRYIDELICQWHEQEEKATETRQQWGQMNLKQILHVNQLLTEFDNSLEVISMSIHDFWDNLLKQREAATIFTSGISISSQLLSLQTLIKDIEEKQNDQESNVYLKMASFYNLVVFKQAECAIMLEKARVVLQSKKINKIRDNQENNLIGGSERCLIMTRIDIKKPMKIDFINKAALKLLQYSTNEVDKMTINSLMPQFISQMHSQFLFEFMQTGKARMIKKRRELFIKIRSGCVIPIFAYLSVNVLSRKHMIFIFDRNTSFRVFEELGHSISQTFLIADRDLDIGELAHNFEDVTGVPSWTVRHLQQELDRQISIDHVLKMHSWEGQDPPPPSVSDLGDKQEVEITFDRLLNIKAEYEHMRIDEFEESKGKEERKQNINSFSARSSQNFVEGNSKKAPPHQLGSQNPIFTMKIVDIPFLDGRQMIKLIAFKKYSKRLISVRSNQIDIDNNVTHQLGRSAISKDNSQKQGDNQKQGSSRGSSANVADENQYERYEYIEISSQTSSSSGQNNSANTLSVLSAFIQKESTNSVPKTLAFIINMILLIVAVIITANSVILYLFMLNANDASNSIQVSKHAFEAVDEFTLLRVIYRAQANIYQGYLLNNSTQVASRSDSYVRVIQYVNENLYQDAQQLQSLTMNSVASSDIDCWFITSYGELYDSSQSLSNAMNVVAIKGQEMLIEPYVTNAAVSNSNLTWLNFQTLQSSYITATYVPQTSVSQIEGDLFFILNNTNGGLYETLNEFSPTFVGSQISLIETKLSILTGTAIGVIAIILLSALVIIPLFGKIQTRILELMKLFFFIDHGLKRDIIAKIKEFQVQHFKYSQFQVQQIKLIFLDWKGYQERLEEVSKWELREGSFEGLK